MVKIQYSELPSGLHVSAMEHGRRTIIYLQPGLTPAERHAALIRVRSSSRIGHGPQLHALGVAVAIGADWIRTATRHGTRAMRRHPVLLLPPLVLLVSTAMVLILMSIATLTAPPRQTQAQAQGPVPAAPVPASRHGRQEATQPAGEQPGSRGGELARLQQVPQRTASRDRDAAAPASHQSASSGKVRQAKAHRDPRKSPGRWSRCRKSVQENCRRAH